MKFILYVTTSFLASFAFSQIDENFTDGNFTTSPEWVGSTSDFIINSSNQLQLYGSVASTSYLTSLHNLTSIDAKEWHFWLKMSFSPSANNNAKIYLTATNSDLTINPDGFYLQIGETGSADPVRLMKQFNGVSTEICSGSPGEVATSFAIGVKVLRDISGNWKLFVDPTGGQNFVSYAIGNDPESIVGTSSGIVFKYSITNATKFYLDNFYVGNEIVDVTPAALVSSTIITSNQLDVLFDQPIEISSAQNVSNYSILPFIGISGVSIDNLDPALVHISLYSNLVNGQAYILSTSNIADYSGNYSPIQTSNFTFLVSDIPENGDIIITEFMTDPSPSIGLAEVEYIEIFNSSAKYFNLHGWKIGDSSGDGTLLDGWIMPNEYIILCSTGSLPEYPNGVGATSFPSLNNAGDDIVLKFNSGEVIDKVSYTDKWYLDEIKKEGGYSLERINLNAKCSMSTNWKASVSPNGGTPGLINSVNDTISDSEEPSIISVLALTPYEIEVNFNEGMDSLSIINSTLTFQPNLSIDSIKISTKFPSIISIQFEDSIVGSKEYEIVFDHISDCSNNSTLLKNIFARPEKAEKGDLIINEILFDPLEGGSDFIEIYNTSEKLIDLNDWAFANYYHDTISNIKTVNEHYFLKSKEYVAISSDTLFLKQNYSKVGELFQSDLPSYNIDSSSVYLLFKDEVMDKVSYHQDWHFKLIENPKGKSLERINVKNESNSSSNWHSASESVGFATPGLENSQLQKGEFSGDFSYSSKTISPDNDGFEDLLSVNYKLKTSQMVGTFTIYDDNGRVVKSLFKNNLFGNEGSFSWDGITDEQLKARIGIYIGVFEAFDINDGSIFSKTKAFVVAGKI
jgi:hypothetical protein